MRLQTMPLESGKRPAEGAEPADTYAVCTSCHRISQNLQNCDNCGSVLSPENSVGCYGADPKRQHREPSSPAVNGSSSPARSLDSNSPRPIPQQIFINHTVTSISENTTATAPSPSVRPQTLYMNLRNSNGTPGDPHAPQDPAASSPISASSPAPVQLNTQHIRPSLNNSSHNTRGMVNSNQPLPITPNTPADMGSTDPRAAGEPSDKITVEATHCYIPAQQIRIGSKKFLPLTAVQFKEDGILFTLKDYTYAPVLLNARAIQKCRANLNLYSYPLILLYLEASCMRQIRNIFGLKEDQFNEDSPCELKKCISIYPSLRTTPDMRAAIDKDAIGAMKRILSQMECRYTRYQKMLLEMTEEEAADIMLASLDSSPSPSSSAPPPAQITASIANLQQQAQSLASAAFIRPHNLTINSQPGGAGVPNNVLNNSAMIANRMQLSRPAGVPPPNVLPPNMFSMPRTQNMAVAPGPYPGGVNLMPRGNANAMVQPRPGVLPAVSTPSPMYRPSGVLGPTTRPTLVVPTDPVRWQEMQKNLVMGGVYHVQQGAGTSKKLMYCLWNGQQLVPCVVQNTEVQLECQYVWVGSLKAQAKGYLRIKADSPQGIFVELQPMWPGKPSPSRELQVAVTDVRQCFVCQDPALYAIFIHLTTTGASRIRATYNMDQLEDPCLNPSDPNKKRQRVVLVLKTINKDQWDAMVQMKFNRQKLFTEVDAMQGLRLLGESLGNKKVVQKFADVLTMKEKRPNLIDMQNMAKAICDSDGKSAGDDDGDDDDDDDDSQMPVR